MDRETLAQLRGAKDLIQEGVDVGATALAGAQRDMTHRVYAILGHVPVVRWPARATEEVQQTITDGVYGSIRCVNSGVGDGLDWLLDRWEAHLPLDDEAR